jgi:hypothetical protein
LKVDLQGSRITSDCGLLLVRELDERLGLSALSSKNMMDDRRGKVTQLPLSDLLRSVHLQSLGRIRRCERCGAAAARSDLPVDRLREDLGFRGPALPSRLHWFETEVLSQDENLEGLSRINRELLAKGGDHGFTSAGSAGTEIPIYEELTGSSL